MAVERLPPHPRVVGSSPVAIAGPGREKNVKKITTYYHWSEQDETWAEFSTLESAAYMSCI